MEFNFNKIIVHAGSFHADDVFCVAMAKELNPLIQVERVFKVTPEMETTEDTIVCDIGGGKYDHHQPNCELHEDGSKYAACSLLFRDFGSLLFPREKSYKAFLDRYITPIKRCDNGLEPNPLSSAIGAFNPEWDESDPDNILFFEAVEMAQTIIQNAIRKQNAAIKAESLAVNALKEICADGLLILDQYIPTDQFIGTEAKLIVSPSNRGGYNILTIPKEEGKFESVLYLPEIWLKEKPDGCNFIHQARFIAGFNTLETAIKSAHEALK